MPAGFWKRAVSPARIFLKGGGSIADKIDLPRNEQIRVPKVRLVDDQGKQIGVMPTRKALAIARDRGLDLVLVAPNADPPVAKLMDYGKYKYEMQKKMREAKKKQKKQQQVKQMKFRVKIDEHDYQTKLNHIRRFLEDGARVRVAIMFIGREIVFTEKGKEILERVARDVSDIAEVESPPKLEGRDMWMTLKPKKREE